MYRIWGSRVRVTNLGIINLDFCFLGWGSKRKSAGLSLLLELVSGLEGIEKFKDPLKEGS